MKAPLHIKNLKTIEEMKEVQQLEKKTWGHDDYTPTHQTITVVKNGGIMLGGYVADELVAFQYSFPGFINGHVYLCSHMLAVDGRFRGRGFGKQLKLAQKDLALKNGFKMITWTYDPLEAVNGNLNIGSLRAVCNKYIENCYGEMEGKLNKGLDSDRFKAEWYLDSKHVQNNPSYKDFKKHQICTIVENEEGLPLIDSIKLNQLSEIAEDEAVIVPVPMYFQEMKKSNMELAKDWRLKTRQLFQTLFAEDYVVVDTQKNASELVFHYILVKNDQVNVDFY